MKCLICQAAARIVQAPGDWSEVKCSAGCGHFRVSANLVAKMKFKNEFFDIERTRRWLDMSRSEEPVPLISTYDYNVSLLHRDAEERSTSLRNRSRKSVTSD
ncbi:hypothetical protein D3C76_1260280 [compost metagenome]